MNLFDEEWVSLEELPNYAVSSYGRVTNVTRGTELTPSPDKNGYFRVALYRNGGRHDVYIHRLVAKCFFDDYEEGVEVRHQNRDKSNNSITNLEMGSGCRAGEPLW